MQQDYFDYLGEARQLVTKVNPITALLLVMEYPYDQISLEIKKIDSLKVLDRLNARIHQAYQLLEYQRSDIARKESQLHTDSFVKSYCDFKTVMEILNLSRAKVETLINEKKIDAIQDKPGEKRRFDKHKIIEYRAGLKK
jgi:hypothetical protein